MRKPILVAGIGSYDRTAKEVLALLGPEATPLEVFTKDFPDKEHYHRIMTRVLNHDIVFICGTIDETHNENLLYIAGAAQKYGAKSLTIIIPYFGYSTMERSTKKWEVVKAKSRCRQLSQIPRYKHGNTVLFFDLHSEGIPYYLEGDIMHHHIYSEPLMVEAISKLIPEDEDYCICSTDAGRAKWVQSLADKLEVTASFCIKRRLDGDKTKLEAVIAHVKDRRVVVFDDMVRTGGSAQDAGRAYKEAGATTVDFVSTHPVLPGETLKKLLDAGVFHNFIFTDSVPHIYEMKEALCPADKDRVTIIPLAPAWAKLIRTHLELEAPEGTE